MNGLKGKNYKKIIIAETAAVLLLTMVILVEFCVIVFMIFQESVGFFQKIEKEENFNAEEQVRLTEKTGKNVFESLDNDQTKEVFCCELKSNQEEEKEICFAYDFDYVVGVVAAECSGEPYEGQLAVAQCILETALKTGKTPEEVVKMKNRYASPCDEEKRKNAVIDACMAVFVNGEKAVCQPIEYFYSTVGGFVSNWHENNLDYVATIGNHKFFMER